jgi:Reverse transcriptase (RNA-dependent DNA polymerase)
LRIANEIKRVYTSCIITQTIRHHYNATQSGNTTNFYCIDDSTTIKRLQHTFGITGLALDWMASYLLTRKSFVPFNDVSSATSAVDYGVPQGSSLGPLLFSLYTAPLSTIVRSFGLTHHQYADDSQIYVSATKNELPVKAKILKRCTTDVHT